MNNDTLNISIENNIKMMKKARSHIAFMVAMHDYDNLHLEKSWNSITHLWKRYDAKIINENFNAREKSNGIVQNNKITFKLGI